MLVSTDSEKSQTAPHRVLQHQVLRIQGPLQPAVVELVLVAGEESVHGVPHGVQY